MLFIFGIVLPIIALLVEVYSNASAEIYVDPIPTRWHTLLVASVPIVNAICLFSLWWGATHRRTLLLMLNGFGIAIAGVYALIYLPIAIVGVFGIVFYGYGFLPLSPILSFICSLVICGQIAQVTHGQLPRRRPWHSPTAFGLATFLGLAAVFAGELPSWVTEQGIKLATSRDESERKQGLYLLRSFSGEVELASQLRRNRPRRLLGSSMFVDAEDAGNLFFQATGKTLSSIRLEEDPGAFLWRGPFDEGLGGEEVADRVDKLSLKTSRMDTQVDTSTSVAYTEWTMIFKNESVVAQEARAQILLPPGGVVSRLTLWVNGEPREAAFSSTGKVRSAYQEVAVVRRRDPVLVTWKGKDRVLMQCFPVPAISGTMKVRVGIAAPISRSAETGSVALPQIIERNFGTEKLQHTVWIGSDAELTSNCGSLTPRSKEDQFALTGGLSSKQLSTTKLKFIQSPPTDPFKVEAEDVILAGTLTPSGRCRPETLIFVVDGSSGMSSKLPQIAEAMHSISESARIQILFASDDVVDLTEFADDEQKLAKALNSHKSAGGCDNSAALVQAWDLAGKRTEIVWVHGIQPLRTENNDALNQRIENDFASPTLWDLQLVTGANRVLERFHDQLEVERISFTGDLTTDLSSWWVGLQTPNWEVIWEKAEKRPNDELVHQPHAGELWAFARVGNLLRESRRMPGKKFELRDEATRFAAASHLVTPVSGAVVLETQEQYDRHGLVPEDQKFKQTAVTPEPSSGLLMLFTVLPVFHWLRRQRGGHRQGGRRR